MTGPQAARAAEDPVRCPPAGPATDPTFDNEVLEQLICGGPGRAEAPATARPSPARRPRWTPRCAPSSRPTWGLMWRAVDLLRALPEAAHVASSGGRPTAVVHRQARLAARGRAPQPRRDGAVAAARRLARLEREQQRLAVERAYDDPLVMAEYRLTGEAFAGRVVAADPARLDTGGKGPSSAPDHRGDRPTRCSSSRARCSLARPARPEGPCHRRSPAAGDRDPGHARAQGRHGPRR